MILPLTRATFCKSFAIFARYWKEWSANLINMSLAVFKLNTTNACLLLYVHKVTDWLRNRLHFINKYILFGVLWICFNVDGHFSSFVWKGTVYISSQI